MSFDLVEAIRAHIRWKHRLTSYLAHPDDSLDPSVVHDPNVCALGKWLADGASDQVPATDLAELRSRHEGFHRAAAAVVRRSLAGERVAEELELGADSEFGRATARVIESLRALVDRSRAAG